MARFELKLPKMGESVAEATITNWLKQVGDKIEADDAVLEIATDKVDSEVPSEVSGVLVEQLFAKHDLVQVGQTIAIIETEGGNVAAPKVETVAQEIVAEVQKTVETFLEGFQAKDTIKMKTVCSDKLLLQSIKEYETGGVLADKTKKEFYKSIGILPKKMNISQKILSYSIQIDGSMAHVWAPSVK